MRAGSAGAALATALVLMVASSSAAIAAPSDDSELLSEALDEGFRVTVASHLSVRIDDTPMTTSDVTVAETVAVYEESVEVCALRQGADEEGELLNAETGLCEEVEGGPSVAEVVALVSSEFKTLPLAAPVITAQPEGDWALVNMDYIVLTDADQQVLSTTILGIPVTVRATPVHYSWDFGDGSPVLSTTDPGQPYPDQTVAHVYTSAADAVQVTLTTSWQGELQINGSGVWLPIAGFATTTSSTPAVEIVAMDVHLVPND